MLLLLYSHINFRPQLVVRNAYLSIWQGQDNAREKVDNKDYVKASVRTAPHRCPLNKSRIGELRHLPVKSV